MENRKKCIFLKSDKTNCDAWPMYNSDFCFFHNPKTKKSKNEAVIKGGKGNKKNHQPLEEIKIKDNKDVVKLIVKTINEVRQGSADVRIANCIFYGTGQLIKALELAGLEERIAKIEEIISDKNYNG